MDRFLATSGLGNRGLLEIAAATICFILAKLSSK
jgi:hypothetical protein